MRIHALTAGAFEWTGSPELAPAFSRSGVYAVATGGRVLHVGVRAADSEGRMRFLDGPAPALGGQKHRVLAYRDPASFVKDVQRIRSGTGLFVPFLTLALLAVLLEGWIVNRTPRRRPAGTGAPRLPVLRKGAGMSAGVHAIVRRADVAAAPVPVRLRRVLAALTAWIVLLYRRIRTVCPRAMPCF